MNVRITMAAVMMSAGLAAAQPHEGDVLLTVESGVITTNGVTDDGELAPGARVFLATFGGTFPNFTDEPGFDSAPATFPFPSAIGFRVLGSLKVWNGTEFAAAPGASLELAFSTLSVVTPPDESIVTGFSLGVSSNGQWHRHLEYTLQPPAADGIYLLAMDLFSTAGAVGPSRPFWFVFNQNDTTANHDAAAEWVFRTLAGGGCGSADFDGDGDTGTDSDIEAFFACLGGACCATCGSADFNGDGDTGTDADIEAFFRVLAGGAC